MGDMVFLAAGYAVFLTVIFVFVYSLVSRQKEIQKDLEMLKNLIQDENETD